MGISASAESAPRRCKSAKSRRRYEFLHSSSSEPMIRLPILHLQYQWLPHWPSLTLSNGTNTLRVWPVISAHCLRFVYFIVCTAELYFISPLPFHAPGSTVILCSFTHLFPSSLLMLPAVHRCTGPAPKHAESQ